MPSYLTPARYRTMAFGIDLADKTDAELASLIASASAEVHRYCAAPVGHDFRGGSVLREEHPWDTGNVYKPGSGRLWPIHGHGVMPIIDCTQIDIYVTKTNYVRFTPDNIFTSSRLGWVEPVAAPITTALFTSVPPWLLSTPMAYIDYTYGRTFTATDEILIDTGDHRTYYAQNQAWAALTEARVNGSPTAPDSLSLAEGTVTYTTPLTTADTVTADYTYKLPEEIRIATAIVVTDMLGYSNINASGLTGLSGIRIEEIEIRQSARSGFGVYNMHPAAKPLLDAFSFMSMA